MQKIKYKRGHSLKSTFHLNISIKSLSQKVWVSPSYEKSKLDADWETHSVIIIIILIIIISCRFIGPCWPAIFFVLQLFVARPGPVRWKSHQSFAGQARPVGKITCHLPAQPVGKITSPLPARPGPVQTSTLYPK